MSYIAKLDKQTTLKLDSIYNYTFKKWRNNEIADKPTRLGIIRSYIHETYTSMVEEGEIVE